jgi:site-specific recombinase XerD
MYKNNPIAVAKSLVARTQIVPYLTLEEVKQLCVVARNRRNGERDFLLLTALFQTGLRVSELLSVTPAKIQRFEGHAVISVKRKGEKREAVTACPDNLAYMLKSYAYTKNLKPNDRIFNITRQRAWQIVKEVGIQAGFTKKIWCHLFRHSDAIYRLRATMNPKALQHHLNHKSVAMSLRYLATLTHEDSLRIMQEVQFE